jgi:hypothetical protein
MPSRRHRANHHPSRPRLRAGSRVAWLSLITAIVLVVGACSAQPVSEVTVAPEPPSSDVPASEVPASAPPASISPESSPPASDAPTATPTVAPADAPPGKPTGTKLVIVSEQPAPNGGVIQTHRLTWEAPAGEASSFLVYGVKDCLRASKANDGTPCVIKGMRIPKSTLVKLAEAPGTDRSIDIDWTVPASGKVPYAAILIRARNAAGDSIFTIAFSNYVCWGC